MITQAILDFIRDVVVNWVTGVGTASEGIGAAQAGAAIGGVAGQAGHFLALFVSPAVWPFMVAAWGIWFTAWLTTAVVAIIARRGASA